MRKSRHVVKYKMKIDSTLHHFLKTISDNKILSCKQCVTAKHVSFRDVRCAAITYFVWSLPPYLNFLFSICTIGNFESMMSNNKNK